jgi:hypothetical protein
VNPLEKEYIPLYKRQQIRQFESSRDPFEREPATQMLPAHREDMIEVLEASERRRQHGNIAK